VLDLRVGPLAPEGGMRIVRESGVAGLNPVIERLADEIAVERRNGSVEDLRLRLTDRR
jgi:hypothetical protein